MNDDFYGYFTITITSYENEKFNVRGNASLP